MSKKPKAPRLRTQLVELPARTLPYWNVAQVKCALDQHEIGMLQ